MLHQPVIRSAYLHFTRDHNGNWWPVEVSAGFDLWEVVCSQCGDPWGPWRLLPDHLRELRGPYRGRGAAKSAAARHRSEVGDAAGAEA